jgi:ubiquinone/menaquinone biosynthesis C-methylase UbiE
MGTDEVRRCYDDMAQNWRLLGIVDAMLLINRLRKRQFSTVEGDVLDVACGTGENFEYLSRASTVTAIDLSPEMVVEARRRARQMQEDIAILVGDAQRMPFADDTFDVVVSALSSCTFPDHVAAFREMARVVRPGGRILLVEHGRSSVGWIGDRQDRNIERVYRRSACRNNRDVTAELAESGLNVVNHRRSHLGMLHRVSIDVARAGCSA